MTKPFDQQPIYQILFESIEEGLIVVNKEGQITMSNPRSWELFGYSQSELEKLKVEDLVPAKEEQRIYNIELIFIMRPKNDLWELV